MPSSITTPADSVDAAPNSNPSTSGAGDVSDKSQAQLPLRMQGNATGQPPPSGLPLYQVLSSSLGATGMPRHPQNPSMPRWTSQSQIDAERATWTARMNSGMPYAMYTQPAGEPNSHPHTMKANMNPMNMNQSVNATINTNINAKENNGKKPTVAKGPAAMTKTPKKSINVTESEMVERKAKAKLHALTSKGRSKPISTPTAAASALAMATATTKPSSIPNSPSKSTSKFASAHKSTPSPLSASKSMILTKKGSTTSTTGSRIQLDSYNHTNTNIYQAVPKGHFDIRSLKPLKSKAQSKKKWVELYCKGLKEVVCCFRGHHDAALALNIDRNSIRMMCVKEGDNVPIFETFSLLHASNKFMAPAYHYGVHEEDHKVPAVPETYGERLARFRRVHAQDLKKEEMLRTFHGKNSAKMPTNEVPLSFLKDRQSNTVTTGGKTAGNTGSPPLKDGNMMVTVVEDDKHLLSLENQGICIVCQNNKADIVFHPCRHAVVCEICFLKGHCSKFCPECRTTLQSSSKPEKIKFIRPRIFSSYAFVTDDL